MSNLLIQQTQFQVTEVFLHTETWRLYVSFFKTKIQHTEIDQPPQCLSYRFWLVPCHFLSVSSCVRIKRCEKSKAKVSICILKLIKTSSSSIGGVWISGLYQHRLDLYQHFISPFARYFSFDQRKHTKHSRHCLTLLIFSTSKLIKIFRCVSYFQLSSRCLVKHITFEFYDWLKNQCCFVRMDNNVLRCPKDRAANLKTQSHQRLYIILPYEKRSK